MSSLVDTMSKNRAFFIRRATRKDHDAIVKIAKQSRYTRDFTHMMFSGEAAYEKGWIRVAVAQEGALGFHGIVGFTCVRHKVRSPETKLYFIGVDARVQSRGIGALLMKDLYKQTPYHTLALDVEKKNERAIEFYKRDGWTVRNEEALNGKALTLEKRVKGKDKLANVTQRSNR